MNVPAVTRVLLAAEVKGASTQGLVVLDWEGTHVLPYFSSTERALEFADPSKGGVPRGPGATWRAVEFSPGEILYLLNETNVKIDAALEDALPVEAEYAMAPIDIFVSRLEIESKNSPKPLEGYGFIVS